MAYRGENIDITIKGDSEFNLDELDFKVLVYPDRHTNEATTIEKSAMTKLSDNHYHGSIGYEQTKGMSLSSYTIEILVIESGTSRSIYAKPGAFSMYDSASKNIA